MIHPPLPSSLSPPSLQSRARAAGKKHPKKRGQRATSNIFAMFDQAQIQEFKEVCGDNDYKRSQLSVSPRKGVGLGCCFIDEVCLFPFAPRPST